MPSLTVTIPTKDRPALLRRAACSVLDQVEDVEVIVVDDGSDASNSEQIRNFCTSDPRILLERNQSSRGAPNGRNQGLELARGRYWATLDDDDMWLPGKWDAQHRVLEMNGFPSDLVVVSAIRPSREEISATRQASSITSPERPASLSKLLKRLPMRVFLNSYVVPTELLRSIGGYDGRFIWGEHTDLLIRLMDVARFAGTDHVGVLVDRWHEDVGSRTGRNWERKAEGLSLLLDKHEARFALEPELLRLYRHVLGISHLRAGNRWEAVASLGKAAVTGSEVRPRMRAFGHLLIAAVGGPRLWRVVEARRMSTDEPASG